jgi:hypothetical protein
MGSALAALSALLLPAGQMPKVAGPCGRALCYCAPQIEPAPAALLEAPKSCEHCPAPVRAAVRQALTLSQPIFSATESSGISFQPVFSGLDLPNRQAALLIIASESAAPASGALFPLATAVLDIDTPPPRA